MAACTFTRTTATVAAWNLAGWGGIPTERLGKQVKGLVMMDAELVALVEVPSEEALTFLRDELEKNGLVYDTLFVPQQSDLHIGLLYKRPIIVENARFIDGSDLGDATKRKALVVDVAIGRFDFTLIGVHLKSGRSGESQQIRDEQCKVIGDFITELRGAPDRNPDVVLLGDFNMIPGQDTSNFFHLGGDDIMDFISSWDLQDRYSHLLPAGRANLLDGFAVSRRFSTEYIKGSLRLFPMHWNMDIGQEKFRTTVSDHLPFVATFRIDRARD